MAFPLTHLCVAYRILEKIDPLENLTLPDLREGLLGYELRQKFILGSIAPDAVHYRAGLVGASMACIGATKKVVHLCPVSDEKWGQVTDNDGWVKIAQAFLQENGNDAFAMGYAVHVLTDIFVNKGIWHKFRTKHPSEAARGYKSGYYRDMRSIDLRLYNEFIRHGDIFELLRDAKPQSIPGRPDLADASELAAIQNNLLNVAYADAPADSDTTGCKYVTYQQTLDFIDDTAEFCIKHIGSYLYP